MFPLISDDPFAEKRNGQTSNKSTRKPTEGEQEIKKLFEQLSKRDHKDHFSNQEPLFEPLSAQNHKTSRGSATGSNSSRTSGENFPFREHTPGKLSCKSIEESRTPFTSASTTTPDLIPLIEQDGTTRTFSEIFYYRDERAGQLKPQYLFQSYFNCPLYCISQPTCQTIPTPHKLTSKSPSPLPASPEALSEDLVEQITIENNTLRTQLEIITPPTDVILEKFEKVANIENELKQQEQAAREMLLAEQKMESSSFPHQKINLLLQHNDMKKEASQARLVKEREEKTNRIMNVSCTILGIGFMLYSALKK